MRNKSLALTITIALLMTTPAFGAVYFWPNGTDEPCSPAAPSDKSGSIAANYCTADGSGFVGKGDVQDAFGWNNNQLQKNAATVTFTYEGTVRYTQNCWKLTGNPDPEKALKENSFKRGVTSVGSFDQKTRGNKVESVTGFFLIGFDDGGTNSVAPTDLCPAFGEAHGAGDGPWLNYNPNDPNETSVPEIDGEASSTKLCFNFGTSSVCQSLD